MSEKGVSVKEFLGQLRSYFSVLKKYWYVVLGVALLVGGFLGFQASKTLTMYTADMSFMLTEDEGGGAGAIGGLLGQMGLGSSGGGKQNYNKIMELGFSNKIVEGILFDSLEIDGKSDVIGNHILSFSQDNNSDKKFINTNLSSLSDDEKKLFKSVKKTLVGNSSNKSTGYITIKFREGTGIFLSSCKTPNEDLSLAIINSHYSHLSDFYISNSSGKQTATYEQLKQRADSLERELNKAEYGAASSVDRSRALVLTKSQVPGSRLKRKSELLYSMYAESLLNLERASYMKRQSEAFFSPIDVPFKPLNVEKSSTIMSVTIGLILGAFLSSIVLISIAFFKRMIYED